MIINKMTPFDLKWVEDNWNYLTLNISKSNDFLNELVKLNNRLSGQNETLSSCGVCIKNMIDFVMNQYKINKG